MAMVSYSASIPRFYLFDAEKSPSSKTISSEISLGPLKLEFQALKMEKKVANSQTEVKNSSLFLRIFDFKDHIAPDTRFKLELSLEIEANDVFNALTAAVENLQRKRTNNVLKSVKTYPSKNLKFTFFITAVPDVLYFIMDYNGNLETVRGDVILSEVCELNKRSAVVSQSDIAQEHSVSYYDHSKFFEGFSNVVLVVGERKFHTNKQFLSLISPVFKAMFNHVDRNDVKNDKIRLDGIMPDALNDFLDVVYPEQKPVTDANVMGLLDIADQFEIACVKKKCEAFLVNLDLADTNANIAKLFYLADRYKMMELLDLCLKRAKTDHTMIDIVNSKYFNDVSAETKIQLLKNKFAKSESGATGSCAE